MKSVWKRIAALILAVCILAGNRPIVSEAAYYNAFKELLVPTQITKIGDTYFLVDSYNNQVLFNSTWQTEAGGWQIMANNLSQPHAIAGDGVVYLIVDTENHRVISYVKGGDNYQRYQVFENIGVRPHYIVYDEPTGYFYAWSSMTGEMYLFRRQKDSLEVVLEKVLRIPELFGKYVRSFTIEGDQIYFPCVDGSCIVVADKDDLQIREVYPVSADIAGMVQIVKIQNYYYLSVSTDSEYRRDHATFVRARTLEDFGTGNYENINGKFGNNGAPYYISYFDDAYFTMVIREKGRDCGYKFNIVDDELCNVREIFY